MVAGKIVKTPNVEHELRDKWQLTGVVAHGDGASVIILNDRHDQTTVTRAVEEQIDGWSVSDIGKNYAEFTQDGKRVRLMISEAASTDPLARRTE